jgi:hypothetical protein
VSYLLEVGYLRRFQMQADFSKNYGDAKFHHIFKRNWARQKHTAFVINITNNVKSARRRRRRVA